MYNPQEANRLLSLSHEQRQEFENFVQWYFQVLESNRAHQPCIKWYLHPEAVDRLIALWAASLTVSIPDVDMTGTPVGDEDALKQATSLREWWREADIQNKMLFDGSSSPFSNCTPYNHVEPHTYERAMTEPRPFPKIDWDVLYPSEEEPTQMLEGTSDTEENESTGS